MTRFTEKATVITPSRELQPDEYFNETDHLIYCSKCNTPRKCRHELQGKVLIPSIRCKCQQEIFEQEEVQRKLHEKQMEIGTVDKLDSSKKKTLYKNAYRPKKCGMVFQDPYCSLNPRYDSGSLLGNL